MIRNPLRRFGATFALLAVAVCGVAQAQDDGAYYQDRASLPSQARWMASLQDATPLSQITLPGTHASAAQVGNYNTQTLSIAQQLDAGIRYFDIGAAPEGNALVIHQVGTRQSRDLRSVLGDFRTFLRNNPSEMLLLNVRHSPAFTVGGGGLALPVLPVPDAFLATLDAHYPEFGDLFAIDAKTNASLASLRGKVVMLRNFDHKPRFGGLHATKDFVNQHEWFVQSKWYQYDKWLYVKETLIAADKVAGAGLPFINHLSGGGNVWPWFVASGKRQPNTAARPEGTGQWRPWSNPFPDFDAPWYMCSFIGCEIAYTGMNALTRNYLTDGPAMRYAGIVVADFPGTQLIGAIIGVNFHRRKVVHAASGRCLDLEGGYQGKLIAWSCHGGSNQRFTLRGEQLMANNGKCLDVYDHNVKGKIGLWTCNGGPNQRWKVGQDGAIRSLLQGSTLCLEANAATVVLAKCGSSGNQKFVFRS